MNQFRSRKSHQGWIDWLCISYCMAPFISKLSDDFHISENGFWSIGIPFGIFFHFLLKYCWAICFLRHENRKWYSIFDICNAQYLIWLLIFMAMILKSKVIRLYRANKISSDKSMIWMIFNQNGSHNRRQWK